MWNGEPDLGKPCVWDGGDICETHLAFQYRGLTCAAVAVAAARREGVIEGLGMALGMNSFHHGYVSKVDILTEIARLRAEQKEG